jgi:hypothetical protein
MVSNWRQILSSLELSDKQLDDLNNVLDIQGSEGNYNFDNYMLGMYNGMELMDSIVDSREPKFRENNKLSWAEPFTLHGWLCYIKNKRTDVSGYAILYAYWNMDGYYGEKLEETAEKALNKDKKPYEKHYYDEEKWEITPIRQLHNEKLSWKLQVNATFVFFTDYDELMEDEEFSESKEDAWVDECSGIIGSYTNNTNVIVDWDSYDLDLSEGASYIRFPIFGVKEEIEEVVEQISSSHFNFYCSFD